MTTIRISDVDCTPYLSLPMTIQTTLNEQLDTAMLNLVWMREKAPFRPFEEAVIERDGKTITMIVAADNVTEIFGSGLYNHEVTLIEQTKIAERILCEAKAFTQPLVKNYADGKTRASYSLIDSSDGVSFGDVAYIGVCNDNTYMSPIARGNTIVVQYDLSNAINDTNVYIDDVYGYVEVFFRKDADSSDPELIYSAGGASSGAANTITNWNSTYTIYTANRGDGCYTIRYSRVFETEHLGATAGFCEVNIYVASNVAAKDKYTIDDVCKILLDVAEPLRDGLDTPRYKIVYTDEQIDTLPNMEAPPQLLFPNGRSLWENLREVGRIVHGIPRIEGSRIYFEDLGSTKYADMSRGRIFGYTDSYNAGDYTAALESVASNLINTEDSEEGAISDPFLGGYRSLRAESETVRIKDETGIIYTAYPIEKIVSVSFVYFTKNGDRIEGDISPYIFEKSEYDLLSSYSGGYPSSKTYALYFTQGSQNIQGLWYRAQDSGTTIFDSFERPAIVNVIAAASGLSPSVISDNYPNLCFSVTYITSVTARVRQHRTSYDGDIELAMAYNQSANKMSSRAFGEALRGQAAMMGTTSTSVRYLFRRYSDVPFPGTLYDDENYIASVTTRLFADHCVSEIALSTGYNEIGAYTEMNNAIRQYEIPSEEKRYTVLEEFCVIGESGSDDDNIIATYQFRLALLRMLEGDESRGSKQITIAYCETLDADNKMIRGGILAPVVSYSLGNTLYMGFDLDTNYSAGKTSEEAPSDSAKYRLQKDVPYGDAYYSEAEKLNFSLFTGSSIDESSTLNIAHKFPQNVSGITLGTRMATLGDHPLIWHKDSADSANISYQVHFVTDRGYIIGSGMARSCPYARSKITSERAKIYFFKDRINQLTGTVNTANAIHVSDFSYHSNYPIGITVDSIPTAKFASWAMIRGGEFLFGKNSSTIDKNIYFKFKRRRR